MGSVTSGGEFVRAILVRGLGGPKSVSVAEVDVPTPSTGEVAVDVHVSGVSFPEVLLSRGRYQYRPELPFVLGGEIAGVVRSVGSGVDRWRPGQRVAAYCGTGGLAEVAVVGQDALFELPDAVPCAVGAAVSMNTFTVHFALGRRGRLQAGEWVLVHGAGGAVGSAAVQLATAMGARVIAAASTHERRAAAGRAGALVTIDVEGFLAAVRDVTGGAGVDVVVDPVGDNRFVDSLRALAPEGRLLVVGFAGGSIPEVRVNRLLLTNTSVLGVGWGAFAQRRPGFVAEQWTELAPLVVAGKVWPLLGDPFPLEDSAAALLSIEQRRSTGHVTVAVQPCDCGNRRV